MYALLFLFTSSLLIRVSRSQAGYDPREGVNHERDLILVLILCFSILTSFVVFVNIIHYFFMRRRKRLLSLSQQLPYKASSTFVSRIDIKTDTTSKLITPIPPPLEVDESKPKETKAITKPEAAGGELKATDKTTAPVPIGAKVGTKPEESRQDDAKAPIPKKPHAKDEKTAGDKIAAAAPEAAKDAGKDAAKVKTKAPSKPPDAEKDATTAEKDVTKATKPAKVQGKDEKAQGKDEKAQGKDEKAHGKDEKAHGKDEKKEKKQDKAPGENPPGSPPKAKKKRS